MGPFQHNHVNHKIYYLFKKKKATWDNSKKSREYKASPMNYKASLLSYRTKSCVEINISTVYNLANPQHCPWEIFKHVQMSLASRKWTLLYTTVTLGIAVINKMVQPPTYQGILAPGFHWNLSEKEALLQNTTHTRVHTICLGSTVSERNLNKQSASRWRSDTSTSLSLSLHPLFLLLFSEAGSPADSHVALTRWQTLLQSQYCIQTKADRRRR